MKSVNYRNHSLFFIFDVIISAIAVGRQTLMHYGVSAKTFIGEFCYKYYTDEYLLTIYENVVFLRKN